MNEKGAKVLKIEATRCYATDEQGHLIGEQEAARREHERREVTLADVQARLAAGAHVTFFQAESTDDARYRAAPASAPPPDVVLPPAEPRTPIPGNLGQDAYDAYAEATGIRRIEHATVIEPDREYAAYARACGIDSPTVRWSR